MVVLPILSVAMSGFPVGYASAPFNPDGDARHPQRAAWMVLAGPGSNLATTLAAVAAIRLGVTKGDFSAPDSLAIRQLTAAVGDAGSLAAAGAFLISIFFSMNLLLFVLNMLRVPPLDGSGALPLVLPERWVEVCRPLFSNPMVAILALLVVRNFAGEVFRPCFFFAVGLIYPGTRYE